MDKAGQRHRVNGRRARCGLRQRDLERRISERQQRERLGQEQRRLFARRMGYAQAKGRRGELGRIERIGRWRGGEDIRRKDHQPDAERSPALRFQSG